MAVSLRLEDVVLANLYNRNNHECLLNIVVVSKMCKFSSMDECLNEWIDICCSFIHIMMDLALTNIYHIITSDFHMSEIACKS